jgi:hypothetical protein
VLSTMQSVPQPTPRTGQGKKRFGVVVVLVAMLLLAYITIALMRATLLSPTQEKPAADKQEQVD